MRNLFVAAALAAVALYGCGKKEAPTDAAPESAAPAGEEAVPPPTDSSPLSDPAAQPIEGDPASAWIELTGVWARTGMCSDDTERWIIEAEQFSLYEMHCPVETLALLQNGVKATSQCAVEGSGDGIVDEFWFLRQGDGSLTIVQGENAPQATGLFPCEESIEL